MSSSGSLPFFPRASSTVSGDFIPQLTFWKLCCCSWPSSLRVSCAPLRAPAMGMCQGLHTEDERGRLRCGQPRYCFPKNIRLNTWMAAAAKVSAEGLYRASLALLLRNLCLIPNLNWLIEILYPVVFKQVLSCTLSDHFPGLQFWCTNEEPSSSLSSFILVVFICCTQPDLCLWASLFKRGCLFPCSSLLHSSFLNVPDSWSSLGHEAQLERLTCSSSPSSGWKYLLLPLGWAYLTWQPHWRLFLS